MSYFPDQLYGDKSSLCTFHEESAPNIPRKSQRNNATHKTAEVSFIKLLCVRAGSCGIQELKRRFHTDNILGSSTEFIFVENELAPNASVVSHTQMSELMRKAALERFSENKVDRKKNPFAKRNAARSLLSPSPPPLTLGETHGDTNRKKHETPVYLQMIRIARYP